MKHKKIFTFVLAFAIACLFGQTVLAQTILRRQDFDANNTLGAPNEVVTPAGSGTVVTMNGNVPTSNPVAATYGAASALTVNQVRPNDTASVGKGITAAANGTATTLRLTFPSVPVAEFQAGTNDLFFSFRIAAYGTGGVSTGIDGTDGVIASISLDGAAFTDEAIVRGNNDSAFSYNSNAQATILYDGNGTVEPSKNYQTAAASTNDVNGLTKLTVRIPDAVLNTLTTGVRLRVELTVNRTDELVLVDDFIAYTNAPTAAGVNVGGKVTNMFGRPVSKAVVSLTDASGAPRLALTNPFGYYNFADVTAGETYIFSVKNKGYVFQTQVLNVTGETEDLNFTAVAPGESRGKE